MNHFEVILNGGLGNQLFGWAAARGISSRTGAGFTLNASQIGERGYQLGSFGIEASFEKPISANPYSKRIDKRVFRKLGFFSSSRSFNFVEQGFRYDDRFLDNPRGNSLYGYFQSWKYFEGIERDIIESLALVNPVSSEYSNYLKLLNDLNFITVHIRRGDYLAKSNYHGLVDSEYFFNAKILAEKLNPGSKFVVFSDSIELAHEAFPFGDLYIGSNEPMTPAENLMLMTATNGIIGSNSSFSWWAAYLNRSVKNLRIFPEPWFANRSLDTIDLVPPSWFRLASGF